MQFDDPNLVSSAGLLPALALADAAGLRELADRHLSVPTDKGANAGLKVASLVAGMAAGADSIEDMGLLRHGGMNRVFIRAYAPSTLGSFLRAFAFGHIRQLDAVASRFLLALSGLTQALGRGPVPDEGGGDGCGEAFQEYALVDVDDTIIEVHGHAKQGAGFGYTRVRGLNALLAILTTTVPTTAPLVVAQRLRKGACNSARGAKRLVGDAVKTTRRMLGHGHLILVRMDSAFYGRGPVLAALAGGAQVSVTVRMNAQIRAAIASIADDAWTTIEYTDAVYDEASGRWVSRAEVAETGFTAFASAKKAERVPGRLVVRRIPDFNAEKKRAAGQDTLFEVWRFHAFFTTTDPAILDTVAADKTHRGHAIIEQVHADLKGSALAHLPSGVFTANAAWLVLAVMAFNLTRVAGTLSGPELAKSTTATIRRKLINVPARVATSGRRLTLHLPTAWPLGSRLDPTVRPGQRSTHCPRGLNPSSESSATRGTTWNARTARSGALARPAPSPPRRRAPDPHQPVIGGSGFSSRAQIVAGCSQGEGEYQCVMATLAPRHLAVSRATTAGLPLSVEGTRCV